MQYHAIMARGCGCGYTPKFNTNGSTIFEEIWSAELIVVSSTTKTLLDNHLMQENPFVCLIQLDACMAVAPTPRAPRALEFEFEGLP